MNFSAVILAGGKSSRMGRDKAFLEIGGKTLLERQIRTVKNAGANEVFISGRPDADYSQFDCRVLADRFPGAGPLAGIERALSETSSPLVLVVAVDMPGLTPEFLAGLKTHCEKNSGAITCVNGNMEPLVAYYPSGAQPLAENKLKEGSLAMKPFAELCVKMDLARFVHFPPRDGFLFANWNHPNDTAL
ncbi:MAG TPA: molybdenum cofactor guanylyltransferase [Verrucomicrobiae bacterium]|nr:molybdenum cofactor guanylyltransferase [Verrucomicrobiae bacterium]